MSSEKNTLTLAVAGSRKTQSIVDSCAKSPADQKILIITYTKNNQDELKARLAGQAGDRTNIEVVGWFAFLIGYFVRPYLPFFFPGRRIEGFDFNSDPMIGRSTTTYSRYFNLSGRGRRPHLAQLAFEIERRSKGEAIRRLPRLFDRIYIDEVQDLCGWDLEILKLLMRSDCALTMVGDVRQAILSTNPREKKNKKYMYMPIWQWFLEQEKNGLLTINHNASTWRCRPEIAAFADSLFDTSLGFEPTTSLNNKTTHHDGVLLVRKEHLAVYMESFDPLFLRYSVTSAKNEPYEFLNIGLSKGLTSERVIIWPTKAYIDFVTKSIPLTQLQASYLYVAVTRAEQSVAFVIDDAGISSLPFWSPGT